MLTIYGNSLIDSSEVELFVALTRSASGIPGFVRTGPSGTYYDPPFVGSLPIPLEANVPNLDVSTVPSILRQLLVDTLASPRFFLQPPWDVAGDTDFQSLTSYKSAGLIYLRPPMVNWANLAVATIPFTSTPSGIQIPLPVYQVNRPQNSSSRNFQITLFQWIGPGSSAGSPISVTRLGQAAPTRVAFAPAPASVQVDENFVLNGRDVISVPNAPDYVFTTITGQWKSLDASFYILPLIPGRTGYSGVRYAPSSLIPIGGINLPTGGVSNALVNLAEFSALQSIYKSAITAQIF